jgi:hypothetical protein
MLKLLKARHVPLPLLYSENFSLRRFSRELSAIPDRLQNVVPAEQLVNDLHGNVRPIANQTLASWGSFWKKRGRETQTLAALARRRRGETRPSGGKFERCL